jgi:hypothetical protein
VRAPARTVAVLGTVVASVALLVCSLALGFTGRVGPPPRTAAVDVAHERGETVVSIEFDHALADAFPGVQLANSLGLKVTLFAMSGRVGLPGYMTAAQLRELQAQGDEIGGHTIDHMDLSQLAPDQQTHEICDDRTALEAMGLNVTDFAYPYGHLDAATPGIVQRCGYQSARGAGGLASVGGCYGPCPPVESIPPADPWLTRTVNSVLDTTSLDTIEGYVTQAERHPGGWLQIVFHYVCDACDPYSVSGQNLAAFLTWLKDQTGAGIVVETVRQVINTPFDPGPVRISVGRGSPITVAPGELCPSTPANARCRAVPARRAPRARSRGGPGLRVNTNTAVTGITLLLMRRARGHEATLRRRAVAVDRGRLRWRIALPVIAGHATAVLTVTYQLGRATYRFGVAGSRGDASGRR